AMLASQMLKEKMVRTASNLLEASIEDIDVVESRVFVVGTDRSLTFRELAKAAYSEMGRLPADLREELEVTKLYDPVFGHNDRGDAYRDVGGGSRHVTQLRWIAISSWRIAGALLTRRSSTDRCTARWLKASERRSMKRLSMTKRVRSSPQI